MLSLEGVRAGFGRREVLTGVELRVPAGEVHGVVGANGAGKTTLLRAIFGLVPLRAGRIDLAARRPDAANTAYLPTESHFYPRITGREYLSLFRETAPGLDPEGWAALFSVPLDELVDRYSAGMKKKLALIAVLSRRRDLALLDEPANNLDAEANLLLAEILRELAARGRSVVVTSHVMESLTGVCHRIHLLAGGRIERSFEPAEYQGIPAALLRGRSGAAEVRRLLRPDP